MVKRFCSILIILIFIISCGPGESDGSVNLDDQPDKLNSAITDQNDLLISPDDIDIDPSVPILDDTELFSKLSLSSFDSEALGELFDESVAE